MKTEIGACVAGTADLSPVCHWSCDGTIDTLVSGDALCTGTSDVECTVCSIDGMYLDTTSNKCTTCGKYCLTCTAADACTLWEKGHFDATASKLTIFVIIY